MRGLPERVRQCFCASERRPKTVWQSQQGQNPRRTVLQGNQAQQVPREGRLRGKGSGFCHHVSVFQSSSRVFIHNHQAYPSVQSIFLSNHETTNFHHFPPRPPPASASVFRTLLSTMHTVMWQGAGAMGTWLSMATGKITLTCEPKNVDLTWIQPV